MGTYQTCLLPLLLLLGLVAGRDLPPYIKACSESDPKVNECARRNAIAAVPFLVEGDPSIRLLPLDPEVITEVAVDQNGLKFVMRDVRILGQSKVLVRDVSAFPSEKRLELDLWFPVLDMSYKYNVSGRVLVLPLDGAGTGSMRLENVTIFYKINYEPFTKKGIEYIKAKVSDSRGDVGHMSINLQNLFNGDKFLGDSTNKVLNENWQSLVEDVGPAMFESFRAAAQNLVDTIFSGVPYRKVILE